MDRQPPLSRIQFPEPEPFEAGGPEEVDITGFGAVIFTSGFRPDFESLLPWSDVAGHMGFPNQLDGVSLTVPGLYFMGTHFLRTRRSSLLSGVGEDAALVAEAVTVQIAA